MCSASMWRKSCDRHDGQDCSNHRTRLHPWKQLNKLQKLSQDQIGKMII